MAKYLFIIDITNIYLKDKGAGLIYPILSIILFFPFIHIIIFTMLLFYITVGKKYHRGIIITQDAKRYRYMSIKQLQDLTKELKEEAKNDPGQQAEYHAACKALEDKIHERDRKRPRCLPTRFEHELDLMEEF